jgi:hypothetical protein
VDVGGGPRLFFLLANAQPINQCIAKVRPEEDKVKGRIRDLWPEGPEVYNAASWDDVPVLFWSMLGVPALVMGIVIVLLLMGGRWIAALGVLGTLLLVEFGIALLIMPFFGLRHDADGVSMSYTTPMELFQPSAFGVLLVVPPLICLMAAGILLIAERYYWVLAIIGGMVVYLAALLLVQVIADPVWWPLKVDFSWMLLLIAFLLSAEWFTRKMLRLA